MRERRFNIAMFLVCAAFVGITLLMLVPLPAWLIDIGISFSIAISVWTFSVALFVDRPVHFSTFPLILLVSLILRLALNISSTRLIISDGANGIGAAGSVIEGIATFVMGGDAFLGIVIFLVLLVVNYVVITKGASRMAEVSARFALDGMPGKQLAIDSDLSAGVISHEEAKHRRSVEQAETSFFGSLDGASKFVKGDAIAGLIIVLINILAGLFVGIVGSGMTFSDAFSTYSTLTIGDGLVSQMPAVIMSIAAAVLLARGGSEASLSSMFQQFFNFPTAVLIVCVILFIMAILPIFPFWPFFLLFVFFTIAFVRLSKSKEADEVQIDDVLIQEASVRESFGDVLTVDDLRIEFSADLIAVVLDEGEGLELRVNKMREYIADQFGLILADVRLSDNPDLEIGQYKIYIQDSSVSSGKIHPGKCLALVDHGTDLLPSGIDCFEPVFGAQGRWVEMSEHERCVLSGHTVISPIEVVATHILEVVKSHLDMLLSRKCLNSIIFELKNVSDENLAFENAKLLDDMLPEKVTFELLHSVLRLLLREHVSIKNIPLILEAIVDARSHYSLPEQICEHVRQRLAFHITSQLKSESDSISILQLSPDWEQLFESHEMDSSSKHNVALPPEIFSRLTDSISEKISELNDSGSQVAFVVNSRRRRFIRDVIRACGIKNPVLSFEELGTNANAKLVGFIRA